MRRVGIFGGSFDPPHRAHYEIASLATERVPLDLLYFVPSYKAPLKGHQSYASPEHRVAMVELLVVMRTGWEVCTYEIQQQRSVATIETIMHLRSLDPDSSFHLIMGGDQWAQFNRWEQADKLMEMVQIVCFPRGGFQPAQTEDFQPSVIPFDLAISSSLIRDRISTGCIPDELLLPEILTYIQTHKLYQ